MQKKSTLILELAAVAGVALWFWLRRDDEAARVRRTVDALASVCSRPAGESLAGLAMKRRQLEGLLAPEIEIQVGDIPVSGSWSNNDLANQAAQIRAAFKSIDFTVHDVTVTLVDATHAAATFTARFRGVQGGGIMEEIRPLTSRLVKLDGRWRFAAFAEQVVLRK